MHAHACLLVVEEAVVDAAGDPEAPVEGGFRQDIRATVCSARPVAASRRGSTCSRSLKARWRSAPAKAVSLYAMNSMGMS